MAPLSIITVCKGRLAHLKESLPSFVAQNAVQIIVVDYDCPEKSAEFVTQNYPSVTCLKLEHRPYFNNWEARNQGAQHATGSLLAFVDADVILARGFSDWVTSHIQPGTYGKMPPPPELRLHGDSNLHEGSNRLEGLIIVPRKAFQQLNGYDDLLQGWGAGGDIDLIDRLAFFGFERITLPEELVQGSIQHSTEERVRFHQMNTSDSHLIGLLYRNSKNSLMRLFRRELSDEEKKKLYTLSENSVARRGRSNNVKIDLLVTSIETAGSNYKVEQRISTSVSWR